MGKNSDASELHVSKHEALDADKTPHEHSTCKLNPAVSCDRTGPNRTVPNIAVKCHGYRAEGQNVKWDTSAETQGLVVRQG